MNAPVHKSRFDPLFIPPPRRTTRSRVCPFRIDNSALDDGFEYFFSQSQRLDVASMDRGKALPTLADVIASRLNQITERQSKPSIPETGRVSVKKDDGPIPLKRNRDAELREPAHRIKDGLKQFSPQSIFVSSRAFPDVGVLVEGRMGGYDPPYSVEVLFLDLNAGFAVSSREQLVSAFTPLIEFGEEMKIINYERTDKLGIKLKTAYLNARQRESVYSLVADVISKIFFGVVQIPDSELLMIEEYKSNKHLKQVPMLWPN